MNIYIETVLCAGIKQSDTESHTGDKATIEDITKRPLKVIFENNAVKEAMLGGDAKFKKPWHKLAYVVDVEVQTINREAKGIYNS